MVWHPSTPCRWNQNADEGGYCSSCGRSCSAFPRSAGLVGGGAALVLGTTLRPQHGAYRPGCRVAFLLRGRGIIGVGCLYGGVVQPEQVFTAWGHAGDCADDQL